MTGPRRLNDLLAGWQPGRARASERLDDIANAAFAAAWERTVGSGVARRSRPVKFRNGVLTVLTASSAWSDELTSHAPAILASLRASVPDATLHRLRFTVASGRTQILFERGHGKDDAGPKRPAPLPNAAAAQADGPDIAALVARLAATQHALDAERDAAGWTTCGQCGKRFASVASADRLCAPCMDAQRRRKRAALERVLMQAPWSSFAHVREQLPETTHELFERTRSSLLARWQADMEAASRRLRRASLTPQDRVVAWSFVMLSSGLAQRDLGRAAVDNVLGPQWAAALFGDLARQPQEARRSLRENHKQ